MRGETNIAQLAQAMQTQRCDEQTHSHCDCDLGRSCRSGEPLAHRNRREAPNPSLQISHRARAVAPGEVLVVDVRAAAPLRRRAGAMDESEHSLLSGGAPLVAGPRSYRRWRGLRTEDAQRRRPAHRRPHDRAAVSRSLLRRALFRRGGLPVAPKFADPPADELPRIEAERKAVEAIFASQTPERFWSQPFIVPVPGAATSSFGRRTILNGQTRGQHTGTDFQAATGTPVVAPNRGRVALAADQYLSWPDDHHRPRARGVFLPRAPFRVQRGGRSNRRAWPAHRVVRRDRARHRTASALDDEDRKREGGSVVAGCGIGIRERCRTESLQPRKSRRSTHVALVPGLVR